MTERKTSMTQEESEADARLALYRIITPAPANAKPPLILWPEGWQPRPDEQRPNSLALLIGAFPKFPKTDIAVVTWTTAEAQALADIATPGIGFRSWRSYTNHWSTLYEPHLTGNSPARMSKCAARWQQVTINGRNVLLIKSELHLSTDDSTIPLLSLWQAITVEAQPDLIITTGTAGGITPMQLGDVLITNSAKFNCTKRFKAMPWAQTHYQSPASTPNEPTIQQINTLIEPIYQDLQPVASRPPKLFAQGDVETVDYFAFADTMDSYHVHANDPDALLEEMDDATLPLATSTPWLSIRNASDPQVPTMPSPQAEKQWAAKTYNHYGYHTSLCSVIATIATIATLPPVGKVTA